jgi:dGTPase
MRLRKEFEEQEQAWLSSGAALSKNSRGRTKYEEPCEIRTEYQRDRDRIIHSKAFRRLKHKTQVFIAPEGDHYRTRLTHTLEVSQLARTAARALRLNEDLTEAIALGHDIGHTPFGHAGEEALSELMPEGFSHNEQSLRVVDHLENLNLTWEVRNGILKHTGSEIPSTLEGQLVRICDRIAYINHDIDDALRAGIIRHEHLPQKEMEYLGATSSRRLNTMMRDLIQNSYNQKQICTSPMVTEIIEKLRVYLFDNVYVGSAAKSEEQKAKMVVKELFDYWVKYPGELPAEAKKNVADIAPEQIICDYIAGMTDRYIITLFKELFVPSPWKK